jgi:hypothetical protein
MSDEFYVYRIYDGEVTVYIGKGRGRRLSDQKRRFALSGEILKSFSSERAAYAFEAKQIAKMKPIANKVAGGGGAITRRNIKLPIWFTRQVKEIERVGSRRWVARELLKLDLSGSVSPDTVHKLRMASV